MNDNPCLGVTSRGLQYEEFSCLYPSLEPFYFSFEKYYDPMPGLEWMTERPLLPVLVCAIYVVCIVMGQQHFESHPRWHWRYTMAGWNLALSLFSFMGMMRTAPQLVHNVKTLSLLQIMCDNPVAMFGSGSTGLWIQLFVLSKFPELLDTFFIVIHKKPLIFLHWYHHITVLLYCWHSYVTRTPPGIFFVTMNYSVHAVMYFYYFLMAAQLKPKWFKAVWITAAQISQMVVGVVVTCMGFYYSQNHTNCLIKPQNNTAGFVMYGSYLILFLQFFVGRYQTEPTAKKIHKVKRV